MKRLVLVVIVATTTYLVVLSPGSAQEEPTQTTETTESAPQKPHVVKKYRLYPKHYRKQHLQFEPWSWPSSAQVGIIIKEESKRWGASEGYLRSIVWCESRFYPGAVNGQYRGLGQYAYSTFTRGVSTMPHGVKMKVTRLPWRHTIIVKVWSDGKIQRIKGYKVHVRRTRIFHGKIPTYPIWTHGWAQVRIMAQAMVGKSAVNLSEWSCA